MSGRSCKRGRPPKKNDKLPKFKYQFSKKRKCLRKVSENLNNISRGTSPEESECSKTNRKSNPSFRGLPRKSVNTQIKRKGYGSEYHYGSDFGDSSEKSDVDDEILRMTASEDGILDAENYSESEFSLCSFNHTSVGRPLRPPSPDPIWLQDRMYPNLELPESSDDLLISKTLVFKALSIYEVLRRFRHLVRLSPFRFEDFCAALDFDEQNSLLTEIHIMLLKAILREEDAQGTHFGPLDQKDSVNITLYLIDTVTWPEILRSYVESDDLFDRNVYNILCSGEYPYTGIDDRLNVLKFLTDQFLTTNAVRDEMLQEGPIHYDDHCRVCHRLGDLLCCETCPAVYHLECVDPPLIDVPTEDWQCNLCKSQKIVGVLDCASLYEKLGVHIRHDILGLDRHGRRFWFIARRIFIEDNRSENVWYYSTISKFEHLLLLIDKEDLELGLYLQLNKNKDEILRQLKITEALTNEHRNNKKSYIELENENTMSLLKSDIMDSRTISDCMEFRTINESIVTRNKSMRITSGALYFKLGMENGFKTYNNKYNTNPIALNKPQRNEERDKRRHLSHKFSLTTASEFKWIGVTMGTLENVRITLRQTILSFEQAIASPFLNRNWNSIKKLWTSAVLNANNVMDFATVLLVFQASIKSVVFANVWHEHLGHICLKRITSVEREERKKNEKREKREREDEEERNRLAVNYVKYSLGLKHQVWKQKGEEYRIHGQWGWMWLSSSRRCGKLRRPPHKQYIKPVKINLHFSKNITDKEVVTVEPRTKQFLIQCQEVIERGFNFKYLEKFKDNNVYDLTTFGSINITKALNTFPRLIYPKMARKSYLDDLLTKRLQLKEYEEQLTKENTKHEDKVEMLICNKSKIHNFLEKRLLSLAKQKKITNFSSESCAVNINLVNSLAKKIQCVRLQFSQLNRFGKPYRCYTKECNTNSNAVSQITQNTCYSTLCLQKARAKKELLLLLRKAHTAGNGSKETVAAILGAVKKPSILEQKLTEGKKEFFTFEESFELKIIDDTVLDILQDWENANSHSIKFNNDFITNCFTREDTNRYSTKDNQQKKLFDNTDAKYTHFIDNMDVCSNVEIESSETIEEMNEVSEDDFTLYKKNKKTIKNRGKTYADAKDNNNYIAEVKKIPQIKQNRRFPFHNRINKREHITKREIEYLPNGKKRVYSASSTKGQIYLLKDATQLSNSEYPFKDKENQRFRFPLTTNYLTHKMKKSILVLPSYELQKLARSGGRIPVNGFHHLAKNNTLVWDYPCSRPLFKTCWSYRTSVANTLASIALQLRILWSCLRWDDMAAKPPAADGKHHLTTDTEIVTLELLKLRHFGRFGEQTQYLRKKIVIPLEQPKTIREVTSIRSGLRKRKRADSPQPSEPTISEEWVEEDKLELWEIKYIGEKCEKPKIAAATRSTTQKLNEPNSTNISSVTNQSNCKIIRNSDEVKGKIEQHKLHKIVQQQHKTNDSKTYPGGGTTIGNRRVIVKNPDGTTRIIHQTITTPVGKPNLATSALSPITSSLATSSILDESVQHDKNLQQNKVQIIRGLDGKVTVRGLNPGQQLIQMSDGKLHVLTTAQGSKNKLPVKKVISSTNSTIKQQFVRHVPKLSSAVNHKKINGCVSVVKTISKDFCDTQEKRVSLSNNTPVTSTKSVEIPNNTSGNVQKLIVQSSRKVLVGQNHHRHKIHGVTEQPTIPPITQQVSSPVQQQQGANYIPTITNPQTTQKVIQQIVNTSNVQQEIMIGDQRIVLSPGQTIVTQRSISQSQSISQQIDGKQSQEANVFLKANQVTQSTSHQQKQLQSNHLANEEIKPKLQFQHYAPNPQQIIVQNSTLAQQLAQGKLQVATINEQQVIIKPLGNNQAQIVAHIKTQSDGNAHIVTNTTLESQPSPIKSYTPLPYHQNVEISKQSFRMLQQTLPNPTKQTNVSKTQLEHTNATNSAPEMPEQRLQTKSIEDSLLNGQPPGTIIKCVTAQVIQTEQGPRIVLQGLVGNDFTQQQLILVQQQVKQQLLKAQESSGRQGVLGPTKIYLAVQPSNIHLNTQPPPLTPVNQSDEYLSKLQQQKDILKRNILKKRSLLERNLQDEIIMEMTGKLSTVEYWSEYNKVVKSGIDNNKTFKNKSGTDSSLKLQPNSSKKGTKKKEKLYCICRTPYDDTKFYVGCDLCSNWFHGECVYITEEDSKKLSEFICCECKRARETQELYCSCRQPYDESQFYICCDKCQDWFHGKCVGIAQSEAEFIDEYVCPSCQQNISSNISSMRDLNQNCNELKELFKRIKGHKSAWPFLNPVNPIEAPDYYTIIEDPIDLQTIERKLSNMEYKQLSKFSRDMIKMFDNCRHYNPMESSFYKCAENLEAYFKQQFHSFKEHCIRKMQ